MSWRFSILQMHYLKCGYLFFTSRDRNAQKCVKLYVLLFCSKITYTNTFHLILSIHLKRLYLLLIISLSLTYFTTISVFHAISFEMKKRRVEAASIQIFNIQIGS